MFLCRFPYITSTGNLNALLSIGRWYAVGAQNSPNGDSGGWMVDVQPYTTMDVSSGYPIWIKQTATKATSGNVSVIPSYYRHIRVGSDGVTLEFISDWIRIDNPPGGLSFPERRSLCSETAFLPQPQPALLYHRTWPICPGATVYGVAFGGCRMSSHVLHWDAFSMYRLADGIVSGDWTLQDAAIAAGVSRMPAYFATALATLKSINFSTVDYITISYGTKDLYGGQRVGQRSGYEHLHRCFAVRVAHHHDGLSGSSKYLF